jgi:tRNA threonylcarbamoyladenosine biosynthesis protein TsaB
MEKISRLLAIETTDVTGSVALCEDGEVVETRPLDPRARSAQSLAPALRAVLNDRDWAPNSVDVVAVTVGPGSFTGLRVGVATAKMFAWAVNAQIVGVDTLDAIACSLERPELLKLTEPCVVSAGVDAQRGDAAIRNYFLAHDAAGTRATATPLDERFRIVSLKKWLAVDESALFVDALDDDAREELRRALAGVSERDADSIRTFKMKDVLFAGPALRRVKKLAETYPTAKLVPQEGWDPEASSVARVAWRRVRDGSFDDVWNILPVYSRRAAAEEKALAKQQACAAAHKPDNRSCSERKE